MKRTGLLWGGVFGLVSMALLSGAAQAQGTPTPKRGGTVVVALSSEPAHLNPAITTDGTITMCYIHEGLVTLNIRTNQFEPALAESWTISPDGKTYTFKLRKATWHDGVPVTSEDVRYTIAEVASKIGPNFSVQAGKILESVTAPDPQTVVIKLQEAYGPLLMILTCANSGIVLPAHLYKGTDVTKNPVNMKPVGAGPFKFSEWVRGDNIRLVRNEQYWDTGKPYLDGVVMRFIPNGGSRVQALIAGEVDFIPFIALPPADGKTVEANPKTKRELTGVQAGMLLGFFNTKRKPFDDVRVRQALLVATDRKYIFDNAFHGLGRPGQGPWTKQIEWAHDPAVNYDKTYPFDPDKAAKMLEDAGYKADAEGIRLRMGIVYDAVIPERVQTAAALKAMWRRAGVELTLQPLEIAVLLPRIFKDGNFDFFIHGYAGAGDPAIGVARVYISSRIGVNFGNASGYSNPEVDALFDKADKLTTYEERGAVYKQIEPILMRDVPTVTLHDIRGYDAASKRLMGAWGWGGHARLGNAWLEP